MIRIFHLLKYIKIHFLCNICSNPLPFLKIWLFAILKLSWCVLYTTVCKFLVIERFWQYFLPVCGLCIHLLNSLLMGNFNVIKNLKLFKFMVIAYWIPSRKSFPIPSKQNYSSIFSLKCFTKVLTFMHVFFFSLFWGRDWDFSSSNVYSVVAGPVDCPFPYTLLWKLTWTSIDLFVYIYDDSTLSLILYNNSWCEVI